MTPKEKAEYLIEKFKNIEVYLSIEPTDVQCKISELEGEQTPIECALITINEMIGLAESMDYTHGIMDNLLDVRCELNTMIIGENK